MSLTSPNAAGLVNVDVWESFMAFPLPLALLGAEGRPELVNAKFLDRYGVGGPDVAGLRTLAQDPERGWRDVSLSPEGAGKQRVRARAIRMHHRTLLIVDEPSGGSRGGELEALRARVGDLERLAATDHLTGAWNRAHLDRVIEPELARSQANRLPLSLILFDIDHFKNINDSFGHATGDAVLRELVRLVRSRTRPTDVLFRWGGEEFVVLVASAGYRHAAGVAETLRSAVAGHVFEGAGKVTVSLGVAEHNGDEDIAAWFRRLDEALYEAKRSGRDRVVVARLGNSDAWAAAGGGSALHLVWQEGYECGDPTIDAEHQELFRLANSLIDRSLRENEDPLAISAALEELLAHVQRHFADEEAILARLGYDQLPEHRRAHAGLLRRALAMAARLDAGELRLGAIVEFVAQDVIARHLMVVDRAFFPLFEKPRHPE
jgi:diguanylate cyclase (GGDEF)-like protein/hemerythrin-like metal-binding protein